MVCVRAFLPNSRLATTFQTRGSARSVPAAPFSSPPLSLASHQLVSSNPRSFRHRLSFSPPDSAMISSNDLLAQLAENPLNWALAALAIFLTTRALFPRKAETVPAPIHAETIVLKNFTPVELQKFNGVSDKKIYLAVKGKIFDVTRGASFYGPEGMYGNFAGRDASRGLAKNSFDKSMLTPVDQPLDQLANLEQDEILSLNEWADFFAGKYDHIGYLVENDAKAQ
ncbi:cytochrome b5-like heme/steroid binding domain-containing protein [Polychytrium aggregatum]|uniref:cytochrome b5-like heme/steroid binding domain-containing protein n=1 Tax=Polychytrium aggregatum TaxID=110093 RepID=UPI0022FE4409|nr:cytochrome b5-like heme/steroid binding domain-containing protein [Polychytrium aggregatum]KAI9201808.1 cytochrome b5-like heme/steroid binding domain-containing protein [Polychytrium aggregatum]